MNSPEDKKWSHSNGRKGGKSAWRSTSSSHPKSIFVGFDTRCAAARLMIPISGLRRESPSGGPCAVTISFGSERWNKISRLLADRKSLQTLEHFQCSIARFNEWCISIRFMSHNGTAKNRICFKTSSPRLWQHILLVQVFLDLCDPRVIPADNRIDCSPATLHECGLLVFANARFRETATQEIFQNGTKIASLLRLLDVCRHPGLRIFNTEMIAPRKS